MGGVTQTGVDGPVWTFSPIANALGGITEVDGLTGAAWRKDETTKRVTLKVLYFIISNSFQQPYPNSLFRNRYAVLFFHFMFYPGVE
ncbi:MAG: hypothetical protein EBS59_04700 [Verrucomicrobia bacterium]|nr:hypothetical protein [Verrucomicrobiota bacterium]